MIVMRFRRRRRHRFSMRRHRRGRFHSRRRRMHRRRGGLMRIGYRM